MAKAKGQWQTFERVTFRGYSAGEESASIGVSIPLKSVFAELGRSAQDIFGFFGGSRLEVTLAATPAGHEPDRAGQQVMSDLAPDFEMTTVADVTGFRGKKDRLSFTLCCADGELEPGELERFKFHEGTMKARRLGDKPRKGKQVESEETPDPNQAVFPMAPAKTTKRGRAKKGA